MSRKKAIDLTGLEPTKLHQAQNSITFKKEAAMRGVFNDKLMEPIPEFVQAPSEEIYSGENNSYIVLGRDRPASRASGYGGRGDTQCGSIDLVVGRMAHSPRSVGQDGSKVYVDPNFKVDSARIHISQKTDIDVNFDLVSGRVGSPTARSGIGLKADHIRLVAREGIKLVTRTDRQNSQGGSVESVSGIDIIAGNNDADLQPMVKGRNTVQAFERSLEHLKNLTSVVETFMTSQMKYNAVLALHTHVATSPGAPTLPSIEAASMGIVTGFEQLLQSFGSIPLHRYNMEMMRFNYLTPVGSKYINSRHNNVN